jgi:F0F1-type ATP synthase membrane subunit b/b'
MTEQYTLFCFLIIIAFLVWFVYVMNKRMTSVEEHQKDSQRSQIDFQKLILAYHAQREETQAKQHSEMMLENRELRKHVDTICGLMAAKSK